ncbi:MAG TPA: tetraacyldisaccharide 4'-kinase [Tepidisphaeraceae bacterium]|jgi:tetraacyldisaccharide 4'-kinase
MPRSLEEYHRDVISGGEIGAAAAMLRGSLRVASPFYSLATATRNAMFNSGKLAIGRAGRPVISVGNITTGGTGKTPVVLWLCQRLIEAGLKPAVLLRGYKGGDEQRMLQSKLTQTLVEANPDRLAGAQYVLNVQPSVDVFVLDDGFQHRRLYRDLDIVLIDASNPFGFGHVLPRGLLREPLSGLARAHAFLITHSQHGDTTPIEAVLNQKNPRAPVHRCDHAILGFQGGDVNGRKVLSFCGIGNPAAFERAVESAGAQRVGSQRFPDHHHYTIQDLTMLRDRWRHAGADALVTTEKDWVKVAPIVAHVPDLPPILRAELTIRFAADDEARLLELITRTIGSSPARVPPLAQAPMQTAASAPAGAERG